jgi:hypothetical protein
MTSQDSLFSRLVPGLLVAAALFAAWWFLIRDPGPHGLSQQAPGVLDAPSSAEPYLLQSSQLGPTFDQQSVGTRAVTAAEIRAGQSAHARDVIESSWKNGARALWMQAHGSVSVNSEAELFASSSFTPVADGIRDRLAKRYHASAARPPAAIPAGAWFLTGHTFSSTYSSQFPPGRQVAIVGWQHGDVLAVIVVTGRPADGVAEAAAKLATTQDGNIGFVAAG